MPPLFGQQKGWEAPGDCFSSLLQKSGVLLFRLAVKFVADFSCALRLLSTVFDDASTPSKEENLNQNKHSCSSSASSI